MTVAEAVGVNCKEELLCRPLVRSDGDNDDNDSNVPLRLYFGAIPNMVVPLTPAVPPTIHLH